MTTTTNDPILMDLQFPIETPRLILRPVMPGDGAAIHEAKVETWDQLTRWMPWTRDGIGDVNLTESVVRKAHAQYILREDMMMVAFEKASGRAVVFTGLHRFCWRARQFEIGYWVRKSAQGKGYATEAANALTRFAFNVLAANSVVINHSADNHPSRKIIERLGFQRDGVLRRHHALPDTGALADLHVYSRLNLDGLPELDVKWGPP